MHLLLNVNRSTLNKIYKTRVQQCLNSLVLSLLFLIGDRAAGVEASYMYVQGIKRLKRVFLTFDKQQGAGISSL